MTMPSEEPGEPGNERQPTDVSSSVDTEATRQQRMRALREIAQINGATPLQEQASARVTREPQTAQRPKWALLAVAVAIIVVATGVGSYLFIRNRATPTRQLPSTVTIKTGNDCPARLLWSPDGKTLAILEYPTSPCQENTVQNALITLYSPTTGVIQQQFNLSTLLSGTASGGTLDGIGWSPDGSQIALEINASANLVTGPVTSYVLLLLSARTGQTHTIQKTLPSATNTNTSNIAPIWNTVTKKLVGMDSVPLPAALSYRWSNGQLAPTQTFPAAGAGAYSGRPTTADTIPFWQDGMLEPVYFSQKEGIPNAPLGTPHPPDESQGPAAIAFVAGPLAAWSPDGSLVTFATFSGLLTGTQPLTPQVCETLALNYLLDPQTLSTGAPACPGAVIPPANPAIANLSSAVLHPLRVTELAGSTYAFYPTVSIAWSPHGAEIATVEPSDQFSGDSGVTYGGKRATTVILLGTSANQPVGQRVYTCAASSCSVDALSWAPTGEQLAMMDSTNGVITLWNTQQVKG